MGDLRFDGKVIIITGAGAGLGRAYALLFGSRGAKVIVNDLGGSRDGGGNSSTAADAVVNEIRRNGGTAIADYNSVVEGEKIVKTALDNFGRIDILINNAGILRDRSVPNISNEDWDLVHAVHLKGSFKTSQAAFPVMKRQGYGRIVMTSSNAGLYGNFGQANYSSAKMGLVGLAKTIGIEGAKYNIHCNVIVPTAASRLTEDIFPPEIFAELKPELIAPVVAYLCHEVCSENGSIIEAAAGWAGKSCIVRANGAVLRANREQNVTLEAVRDNWEKITNMTGAQSFANNQEVVGALVESLDGNGNEVSGGNEENGDVFSFSSRYTILYALGVGATLANPKELKFLYENHEEFSILPTFYIMPSGQAVMTSNAIDVIPGKTVDLSQLLHGEQYIEILDNVPLEGKLFSKVTLLEVLDKGSGAVLVMQVDSFDVKGNLVVRNQFVAFVVGAGNFGGPREGTKIIPYQKKPNRVPDTSISQKTDIDQAAIYRLSGDLNPLHIDPNFAKLGGFDTPILHGLCSLGFSVRMVMQAFADYDVSLFKACKARFVKPVIPGQTLKVDMWKENNRIHFETLVAETGTVVIGGAYVDLKGVKVPATIKEISSGSNLKSDAIFEFIIEQVKADPSKAKSVGGLFLYNITKNGQQVKQWTMDLKNGKVYEGAPKDKPNTTMTISDEDFLLLAEGKLQPQQAFMKGKLKITGNIMLAQKLAPLLRANAKM